MYISDLCGYFLAVALIPIYYLYIYRIFFSQKNDKFINFLSAEIFLATCIFCITDEVTCCYCACATHVNIDILSIYIYIYISNIF
jgi:hypothetical protein